MAEWVQGTRHNSRFDEPGDVSEFPTSTISDKDEWFREPDHDAPPAK
jgi:hypothetical protein